MRPEWEAHVSTWLRAVPSGSTLARGQIDFVWLIRSDRLLKILGVKLPVPETLVHRYVTATLHVRRERLVAICKDLWRMEVPFILNRDRNDAPLPTLPSLGTMRCYA